MQSHSLKLNFSVGTNNGIMSSPLPSLRKTHPKKYNHHGSVLQVRAQSYGDEGRSSNMVDGNLRILKERIKEVREKEILERCMTKEVGWNYGSSDYNEIKKREIILAHWFELVSSMLGTVGLTIFGGSFFICIVSLIFHLNQ